VCFEWPFGAIRFFGCWLFHVKHGFTWDNRYLVFSIVVVNPIILFLLLCLCLVVIFVRG